jgi:hypothetical protein
MATSELQTSATISGANCNGFTGSEALQKHFHAAWVIAFEGDLNVRIRRNVTLHARSDERFSRRVAAILETGLKLQRR